MTNKCFETEKSIVWWGRPALGYSRNLVVRALLQQLGYTLHDFRPHWSAVGDLEASLRRLPQPQLVWVPCFRQRDLAAALRWSHRNRVPLLFDPLISVYDKQVFERGKFTEQSWRAQRLRHREQQLLQQADLILADTQEHSRFFAETFSLPAEKLAVLPVGAEETLFRPLPCVARQPGSPLRVLFYGSFIGLQGPQQIVEAARLYQGPPVEWLLVGAGPLLEECRGRAKGVANVHFKPWHPYEQMPEMIAEADIVLGIFGSSDKAARVIPNKVYQALACGKPVVTRRSPAYPEPLFAAESGIEWVEAGSPQTLAAAVARLAKDPACLAGLGASARCSFERHFSLDSIRERLCLALLRLDLKNPGETL